MPYHIDIQYACDQTLPVSDDMLTKWAELALHEQMSAAELTLRLVDIKEIRQLNHRYRKQDKATNVLAFPSQIPNQVELDYPLLGDVILCPAIVDGESRALKKPLEEHWAHLVIHGVLHLLGYDHSKESDTAVMQALEIKLLAKLGFANPYQTEDNDVG
jgi:probable rRNA maturation factor